MATLETLTSVVRTDWRGRPRSLWALVGLLVVLGVRGTLGGLQFVIDPSGDIVGLSTDALAGSPFADYLLPGLVLLFVLGLVPLLVAGGLLGGRRWAWTGAVGVAVTLAIWVLVEGWVVGFGKRLQYPNLVQSVVMFGLAMAPSVRNEY
jgi:hypothetical protein